jgi:quinol---cytochrome-c reductase cytochrome c subunit
MSRRRLVLTLPAAGCGLAAAAVMLLSPGLVMGAGGGSSGGAPAGRAGEGRALFVSGCSSCHGYDAGGIPGVAPSLHGVGALAADFYLRTGRMPLTSPAEEPVRKKPAYSPAQIAALDAYIGSFGGPAVPHVTTGGTSLSYGQTLFANNCSGCHQITGRGGIVTGAFVPSLVAATPQQIVEAARIGPYLMPRFGPHLLSNRDLAAIAGYVHYVKSPPDRGGWGIGHIGPVPEGMVVWFVAIPFVLLLTRLIGERTES